MQNTAKQNYPTLVQSLLMTLGQEMRWDSAMLASPHRPTSHVWTCKLL